ncbi:hypothetical protein [Actinoplanes derwentensis]|uniref:Uncharacterized protein n=1 Tax=Actinoplanes derwentensis TaxID=113562 RepID=A0A1H2CVI7_9ACTN|nr:hypothetical protein [Actinoplanes derwentensis]GID82076.1 hypothetical protein Ade03nite_10000 [Actinoplanes derwentensis]SDT74560.1 hypothetical protein SAMN04489716_7019 [Actinoplanes derwentensis]
MPDVNDEAMAELMAAVERLGAHLLHAVQMSPRDERVLREAWRLPGVGGRGQGLNASVVASLMAAWADEIVIVGADSEPFDGAAQRLVAAARAGFSVLSAVAVDTVQVTNGADQRATLLTLALRVSDQVLPLLGGLESVQSIAGFLAAAHPPPTPAERANWSQAQIVVAALAAGNHDLGERVLAALGARPDDGATLASLTGWWCRVAVTVMAEARQLAIPITPDDPRLRFPGDDDPALPPAPGDAYGHVQRAITGMLAELPLEQQSRYARAIGTMDPPISTAAARYAAVTIARNLASARESAQPPQP